MSQPANKSVGYQFGIQIYNRPAKFYTSRMDTQKYSRMIRWDTGIVVFIFPIKCLPPGADVVKTVIRAAIYIATLLLQTIPFFFSAKLWCNERDTHYTSYEY